VGLQRIAATRVNVRWMANGKSKITPKRQHIALRMRAAKGDKGAAARARTKLLRHTADEAACWKLAAVSTHVGKTAAMRAAKAAGTAASEAAALKKAREDLKQDGFAVVDCSHLRHAVRLKQKQLNDLAAMVTRDGVTIFQAFDDAGKTTHGDGTRWQVHLGTAAGSMHTNKVFSVAVAVKRKMAIIAPYLECCDKQASLLCSQPKAIGMPTDSQPAHGDAALEGKLLTHAQAHADEMPVSAVLAFSRGTKLELWRGSHRHRLALACGTKPKVESCVSEIIDIPPYHFVVFFTTLVHAGSAYSETNVRLFMSFDHPDVPRKADTTQLVRSMGDGAEAFFVSCLDK